MSVGSGYLESFFKDKSVFKGKCTRDSQNYKTYKLYVITVICYISYMI